MAKNTISKQLRDAIARQTKVSDEMSALLKASNDDALKTAKVQEMKAADKKVAELKAARKKELEKDE
jgi:hypothetical protein